MNRAEFGSVMGYLSAATGKAPTAAQTEVYFDLLRDLPVMVLQVAAKRAVLESPYPSLPTVGTLRQLAMEALGGARPTAGQAWELVMAAAKRFPWREPQNQEQTEWERIVAARLRDVYLRADFQERTRLVRALPPAKRMARSDNSPEAFASLPEDVARAARCIGWRALCNIHNPETMFAQFRDVYKDLETRRERDALLPGTVRHQLEFVRAAGGQLADKSGRALGELVAIGAGETFGEAVRRGG